MFRRNKQILIAAVILLFLSFLFFGGSMETALAPIFFEKLASIKSLRDKPDFLDFGENNKKIRTESPEGFLEAVVIFRPPAISYDHLIVAGGASDGVSSGQIVLVDDGVIIGEVGEVFENSSRIISYSAYGFEQNVFLRQAGVSVSAVGRGNGELEIVLPRDFSANVGDEVVSLTNPPYLVGFVERIDKTPSSPTQKLKIKQPFNIYEFFSVLIRL